MGNSQIRVSVICNAYNHEKYIRKCLDSLVMQRTTFDYEILVHDDASTDKTADIIREFEGKYPDLIKPIYQTENQHSKGIASRFQFPRVRGEYVAICEGDDFWTDELKLQKQFDALEAHPEIDMCAHSSTKVAEDGEKILEYISPRKEDCIIDVEDVILGGGGFVATNSLMYRTCLIRGNEPEFRKYWRIDYTLQIFGSLRGGMLYLSDVMSAYRWLSVGSWTSKLLKDKSKRKFTYEHKTKMLQLFNEDTDYKYAKTVEKAILDAEYLYYYSNGPYKTALSKKYKEIRKAKGIKQLIKLYIKVLLPFCFKE